MAERRGPCRVWGGGNPRERDHLLDLGVDEMIKLRYTHIMNLQEREMGRRLIWLRIVTGGKLL
jgi:hypothetical protein